ncbi:MAG: PepSY domain-containing protein, partial [Syntrophothermus sp.]
VKGSLETGTDSILLYGNMGVWLTNPGLNSFADFNDGFPRGIDNRKISSMVKTPDGRLLAGTLFGLYQKKAGKNGKWEKISLPVDELRIVKILVKNDSLLVLTRSNLMLNRLSEKNSQFSIIKLPVPADDDHKTGLFRTLWVVHSGEIYGWVGKLIVDGIGITFIIICITGLIWFFVPMFIRKIRDDAKSRIKKFNRDSLRVHNWLGSWLLPVLLLTTMTGMFLRPPLLIPIAESRVGKIRFSELDSPNPWFDRFRDMVYDAASGKYLFATGEGIYFTDGHLQKPMIPFSNQPPVSVMGITTFEKNSDSSYIIGSFSGIYRWNPETGDIFDHFTGMRYEPVEQSGPPFGNISVSGYVRIKDNEYIFDYAAGAIGLKNSLPFAPMPDLIVRNSPISLWNTALEFHTGRIYEPLLGSFYILVVPLAGIFTLLIIITGFIIWYKGRKKKK